MDDYIRPVICYLFLFSLKSGYPTALGGYRRRFFKRTCPLHFPHDPYAGFNRYRYFILYFCNLYLVMNYNISNEALKVCEVKTIIHMPMKEGYKQIIKRKYIKMQTTEENSNAGWRRTSNRPASYYRARNRTGSSHGQPVHISFYIRPLMDADGNIDREKFIKLF